MRAHLVMADRPFDRPRTAVLRRPRRIRALAPRTRLPVICILNGRALLRAGWRRRVRDGDHVCFVALPLGEKSNPLQILASLALMAFAPWAAGLIAVKGTLLHSAVSLGIILAGQSLINALLPQPKQAQLPAASPTYDLQAQGNSARIEAPIPVQYGRHLSYPDFAAQPYTEFDGNEQYLYQLLCLGAGEYDIEAIRIEDTPIDAFAEIEHEIVPPGGEVELFPTAVVSSVEVSGQTFRGKAEATWTRSGTTATITETGHRRATGQAMRMVWDGGGPSNGVYQIATVIDADSYTVTVADSGAGSGDVEVLTVLGNLDGFVASGPDQLARHLGVDVVMPSGLFGVSEGGTLLTRIVSLTFQARRIDDSGAPLGDWETLGQPDISRRTTTAQRRSFRWRMPVRGRYAVRAWRRNIEQEGTSGAHQAVWTGLRAYLTDAQDWGPVTLIALRMRASDNLSLQASRRISVIATRRLPRWTGSEWTAPEPTRSIAWALADAARNPDHGAGLSDARLDLPALLALDDLWAARGDSFDARFDQEQTWWEAMGRIALAGRARVFLQGGRLRVVRDGPQEVPVALYSPHNILAGSFVLEYLLPKTGSAREVDAAYFDARTWTQRRARARLPGGQPGRPIRLDLFGVIDAAQALREGRYHLAASRYRRRLVRFATEMEGFLPVLGDLIAVNHDMPGWGMSAEATGWDAGTRRLTLSEPVEFGGGTHVVGLRRRDGSLSGPWVVTAGPDARTVVLAEAPDIAPETTGARGERTHVAFGTQGGQVLARVAAIRPRGAHEVEIEAVVEDPSVHTAETGETAPPLRLSSLPRRVPQPRIAGLIARRMPGDESRVLLSWRPAPGADVYHVEMAEGDATDAEDPGWTRVADVSAAQCAVRLLHDLRTVIRVRGMGLAAGPWVTAAVGDLLSLFWLADNAVFWLDDADAFWRIE